MSWLSMVSLPLMNRPFGLPLQQEQYCLSVAAYVAILDSELGTYADLLGIPSGQTVMTNHLPIGHVNDGAVTLHSEQGKHGESDCDDDGTHGLLLSFGTALPKIAP